MATASKTSGNINIPKNIQVFLTIMEHTKLLNKFSFFQMKIPNKSKFALNWHRTSDILYLGDTLCIDYVRSNIQTSLNLVYTVLL